MEMEQLIERLLAGKEEMKTKMKADVKAWQEIKERGEAEGKPMRRNSDKAGNHSR
jgi:hypothetical protein